MTVQTHPQWHALSADETQRLLETDAHGLSEVDVRARQQRYGANELTEEQPPSALLVAVRQFRSPLIYILVAATVITLVLGKYLDSIVISAVLLLNAVIGFVQERQAERAVRALKQLVVPRARVVRDGQEQEINSRDLVPGDVVLFEPGIRVPADTRLTWTNGLKVDESLLTGESSPVHKRVAPVPELERLADRLSMAYTGAVVASGRGRGAVVATGADTELGAIASMLRGEGQTPSPLQVQMGRFARFIGIGVGVAAMVVFGSGVLLGSAVPDMFLAAVALAVAAIPEGLPIAFTVTLALGVRRMARRNAIVRSLPAVETLGSTTVIGSDKTGTLTENQMTVRQIWTAGRRYHRSGHNSTAAFEPEAAGGDGAALRATLLAGVLANEADAYLRDGLLVSRGDPTEVALLVAATTLGIVPDEARQESPLFGEIPFEPELRYSASVRVEDGVHVVYAKGAPERIAAMCGHMLTEHGVVPLDGAVVEAAAQELAEQGLRVLALARGELPDRLRGPAEVTEPEDMVLLGLQGMMDPPRAGVREAIAVCQQAGVRVIMITGDHVRTAIAIATQLGLAGDDGRALTGAQLSELDDQALGEQIGQVNVYARMSPQDKLRVVRCLQQQGEVVAITGDGVNDAPALKAASIGIAMGSSGTDVARESADMILADDNFVSIAAAVEEGRVTFENVRKVTFFLVSTGAATILAILAAVWLRWPLLMLPAQLLWLNLVTNGLQDVALAFEPRESGVLRKPPRRLGEGVLSRLLWQRTVLVGMVMAAGTLLLFRWELDRTGSIAQAQTVALTTMVIFMAFHAGNARSHWQSALRVSPVSNPFLLIATVCAVGVHVAAIYLPPTQYLLRVTAIDGQAWLRIVVVASSVLVAVELDKLLRRIPRASQAVPPRS